MSKYRKGSMGAAEEKANKWWKIGTAIVAALTLSCFFLFNTDMHDAVKKANLFCNITGFIVTLAGFAVFAYGEVIADDINAEARGVAVTALVLVGFGLALTIGFTA